MALPTLRLTVVVEQEEDGRWGATVPELSGVHAYGVTQEEAIRNVQAQAYFELADRIQHGEPLPGDPNHLQFVAA